MPYVDVDKAVEKFRERHIGDPTVESKVEDVRVALEAAIPLEAFWIEHTEGGITSYHCSACERCYYIKKPKARYCPECGAPIGRT